MTLVTVFGLGHLRPAPGKWGSLPAAIFAPLMAGLLGSDGWQAWDHAIINGSIALLGLAFAIVCVRFGAEAEAYFNVKDPRSVVADEVAGQSVSLLFLPWRAVGEPYALLWNCGLAAASLLLFRIIDMSKPPPIRNLQEFHGGWGILIDDVLAGIGVLAIMQIGLRVVWPLLTVEQLLTA